MNSCSEGSFYEVVVQGKDFDCNSCILGLSRTRDYGCKIDYEYEDKES